MKKLLLLFVSLFLTLSIHAETIPNEVVFYNTKSGEPFTYSRTLEGNGYVLFNCPFVDNVVVDGMHIEFTISNENFKNFVMKRCSENYSDFIINVYYGGHLGDTSQDWPQNQPYTLRIRFNR